MGSEHQGLRSADATALVVSTRCPSCGAPLDFAQASNAIRCDHCASNLLATGRGQVLSYLVRPRVGGADARALARFAPGPGGGGARLDEPRLCFVPYYRLTATEMRWQHQDAEESATRGAGADRGGNPSPLQTVLDLARGVDAGPSPRLLASVCARRRPPAAGFAARRIERSLNATAAGIGAPSLGVRSSVVRLELFRDDALPDGALVAPVDLAATDALQTALVPTGEGEILARAVVTQVLSLLHFPFWTVRSTTADGSRVIVVDALSGTVVTTEAAASLLDRATEGGSGKHATVGFRPLVCPNCGWDLPVEPAAVAFPCAGCDRAWLVDGAELVAQPSSVATPPAATGVDEVDYRPFWEIAGESSRSSDAAGGWLIPAFEHGNVKRLRDLAIRLSRRRPSFIAIPPGTARVDLGGCVLDARDAAAIAGFLARTGDGRPHPVEPSAPDAPALTSSAPSEPRLFWLPFVRDAYGWREPLTGTALPPELAA